MPRHFRVLLTTGSLFLTFGVRALRSPPQIYILPPDLCGSGDNPQTFVRHLPGSTWNKAVSDFFIFVFRGINRLIRRHFS